MKRRWFLKNTTLMGTSMLLTGSCQKSNMINQSEGKYPLVISTWNNHKANKVAWNVVRNGGSALDAVEQGARVPEADPEDMSVGYGGRPDREGIVTLDASIMDHNGNCGAVTFLENIKHPISVARKVMEDTPHVMLSGSGAQQFALENGFEKENLLTEKAASEWKKWIVKKEYKPKVNIELHDTIGILCLDKMQNLAGACTTSGLAYKMRGRVGDSPIIGAGLYVDNEVGAATATGMGEAVVKSVGSFLVVELMRNGATPQEACQLAIERIAQKQDTSDIQVGFIAMNKKGQYGAYALKPGFIMAINNTAETIVYESSSYYG